MNTILDRLKDEMNRGIKNSLYHLTQIKFSYNSNHIEGNSLTHNQTKQIFDKSEFVTDGKVNQKVKLFGLMKYHQQCRGLYMRFYLLIYFIFFTNTTYTK